MLRSKDMPNWFQIWELCHIVYIVSLGKKIYKEENNKTPSNQTCEQFFFIREEFSRSFQVCYLLAHRSITFSRSCLALRNHKIPWSSNSSTWSSNQQLTITKTAGNSCSSNLLSELGKEGSAELQVPSPLHFLQPLSVGWLDPVEEPPAFLWDRAGALLGNPSPTFFWGWALPALGASPHLLRGHPAMGNTQRVKQILMVLSSDDFQSTF